MKLENIEKAYELKKEIDEIDMRIKIVENSRYINIVESYHVSYLINNSLKYGKSVLIQVKKVFLNALNKEKEDILKQIGELD